MKKITYCFVIAAVLAASLMSFSANAATEKNSASDKNWMMRFRGIAVVPQEDASTTIGGNVEIDNTVVPEVDFSYFFTKNWAAELILATTPHDATATAGNIDLGSVWLLPPTLTMQYHMDPVDGWKPYVGAGVNYTIFYNEDKGPAINSIKYDNSFGPALQAGVDYDLKNGWFLNFDVKKIWINTDVKINGGAIRADVDIVLG
ncbi:MAG: OmpW family protein [Alphaproteobacteria bacterium]|nr:MAG: OmpW family protein [Alphaproteobacteria bacterium]